MNSAAPIRDVKDINRVKLYLKSRSMRDYFMCVFLLNSALRVSDALSLRVGDLMESKRVIKDFIILRESKTGKQRRISVNASIKTALKEYLACENLTENDYLFKSRKGNGHISRQQAHEILSKAGDWCKLPEKLSCHSCRKSFGYHAHQGGTDLALLMDLYGHSSQRITKIYIGINSDDVRDVYQNTCL